MDRATMLEEIYCICSEFVNEYERGDSWHIDDKRLFELMYDMGTIKHELDLWSTTAKGQPLELER